MTPECASSGARRTGGRCPAGKRAARHERVSCAGTPGGEPCRVPVAQAGGKAVPKRLGGDPTRHAAAAQRIVGGTRLLTVSSPSPGRSQGRAVEPRRRDESTVLPCRRSRESRGKRREEGRERREPREGQRYLASRRRAGETGIFVFVFCVFRFLRCFFFICSEKLAMFWSETFTQTADFGFRCIFARIFLVERTKIYLVPARNENDQFLTSVTMFMISCLFIFLVFT